LDDVEYCQREIIGRYRLTKVKKVIAGGERRQDSVRVGIEATRGDYGLVLIHDGVRPFVESRLIERAVAAARKELVIKTYDRQQVWLVQTPQVFRYEDIMAAHQKALLEGWEDATDDSFLVEKMGVRVKVIRGSEDNIKVTTSYDLELGRSLLKKI
jgi:2-C-methyl-D-erythritol 4-phosphate cytidylyltransferase